MVSLNTRDLIINIIKPDINKAGFIETIYDPCIGTGNFLVEALKFIIKKAKKNNISIDWDYIMNDGLHGIVNNILTYNECIMNMQIIFSAFNSTRKFNIINTNYLNNTNKYDIIMTHTNTDIMLLYHCITSLNLGGRCCIVLPINIFKANNQAIAHLMETCDIREIIFLSADKDMVLLYFYKNISSVQNIHYYYYNNDSDKILLTIKRDAIIDSNLYLEILRNHRSDIYSDNDITINNIFYSYLDYLDNYKSNSPHLNDDICYSLMTIKL